MATTIPQFRLACAVVGTIHLYDEAQIIDLPTNVEVSAPFSVRIITYGDGCYEQGSTEIDQRGFTATFTPHDRLIVSRWT